MSRTITRASAAVAALAVVAAATGCTATETTSSDDVIRIFVPQDVAADLSTNSFTAELEKKFDVDLEFETTTYDAGAAAEKRQISLASGDYPDAYWLIPWVDRFNQAELLKLGQQGVILPLQDLIEEHAPTISAALEENDALRQLATAPGGDIWGLPQWNDCFHCGYTNKLWMNSEWLDAVGMERPTTPEELEAVLTAFKEQDPNGNGEADEIPLSGAAGYSVLTYLMNPFAYTAISDPTGAQPGSLALDGDEVVMQAATDGWRDGLTFIHGLWEKGLIDSSAFSQNADALKAKGDNAGATIVGSFVGQHPAILVSLGQEDGRDKGYDAVAPLTGPAGDAASYILPSYPGASFVITNKASEAKQAKLIEILDYVYTTDGHLRGEFGKEGVNWESPSEGDVALDESAEPLFKLIQTDPEDEKAQNNAWGALTQFNSDAAYRGGQVVPTDIYDPSGFERRLFEATQLYADKDKSAVFPFWNVWIAAEDASDVSTAQTNVESAVAQAAAEFITGTRDITDDGQWSAYLDSLDANGAETYTSIYQKAWDAVKDAQ